MGKEELLHASMQNLEWLQDNYDQLKKNYDKQWVVIENRKIVSNCSTYDEIMKTNVTKKPTALIEFIDSEQIAMFF